MRARRLFAFLVPLVALALACGSGEVAQQSAPAATGVESGARPPEPPCEGVEEPDVGALVAMLEAHEFEALDAALRRLQSVFETNKACELRVWRGLMAFYSRRQDLSAHLDAWVEAMPDTWTAHAARGAHWTALGYARRGNRLARDTFPEALASMRDAFERALPDIARAIELAPRHLPPYLCGITIAAAGGTSATRDRFLARAVEADPASFIFREKAIGWYGPEWGGSIEEIRRIADSAQAHLPENPRLARLQASAKAREASALARAGRPDEAIALYGEALAICPCWSVEDFFRLLRERGQHERLIQAANRVDEWWQRWGDSAAGWVFAYRGLAYLEIGNRQRARADLERAAEMEPQNAWVQGQRAWFVELTEGTAAALPHYERAWALDSSNEWVAGRLAEALQADPNRRAEAALVLRRFTEMAPEDPGAWLAYGTLLHELGDAQARGALERYLALADPSDPQTQGRNQAVQRILEGGEASRGPEAAANALPALARVTALVEARRSAAVKTETP